MLLACHDIYKAPQVKDVRVQCRDVKMGVNGCCCLQLDLSGVGRRIMTMLDMLDQAPPITPGLADMQHQLRAVQGSRAPPELTLDNDAILATAKSKSSSPFTFMIQENNLLGGADIRKRPSAGVWMYERVSQPRKV